MRQVCICCFARFLQEPLRRYGFSVLVVRESAKKPSFPLYLNKISARWLNTHAQDDYWRFYRRPSPERIFSQGRPEQNHWRSYWATWKLKWRRSNAKINVNKLEAVPARSKVFQNLILNSRWNLPAWRNSWNSYHRRVCNKIHLFLLSNRQIYAGFFRNFSESIKGCIWGFRHRPFHC